MRVSITPVDVAHGPGQSVPSAQPEPRRKNGVAERSNDARQAQRAVDRLLRWDQIDFVNRVVRLPRTKSGRLSLPMNATTISTLQTLHAAGDLKSPYVFPHTAGRKAGEPVRDIKNGFHRALELAGISDFTWHDLRHTFASWLMMRGAALRSVAELLGHQSLKMTMRYAHLSPAFLSAEVGLLDPPAPPKPKSKRARKGQRASKGDPRGAKVVKFQKENGSSGWIRAESPRTAGVRRGVLRDSMR